MDDERVLAVVPFPGARPLEVSIYPDEDEWDCECGSPATICAHVIAAAVALKQAAATKVPLQDVDALLERFPVRVAAPTPRATPEPDEPARPASPRREASRATSSPRAERPRAAATPAAPTSTRRARAPVRHIAPPSERRTPQPVRYRFASTPFGLEFSRVVAYRDDVVTIEHHPGLTGDDAGGDTPIATTEADLLVQEVLDGWKGTMSLTRERVPALFAALADVDDVALDGRPVTTSGDVVAMVAVLEDRPDDALALSLRTEPPADTLHPNGVCQIGDVLHPLSDATGLGGDEVRRLLVGETYTREDTYQLVVHTLPDLERHVPVRMLSDRVPKAVLSEPRPAVYTRVEDGALVVEGRVVYGDPILGFVRRNRMSVVGDAVPIREPEEERPIAEDIHRGLGLVPGFERSFKGAEAQRFARRLAAWADEDDDREVIGEEWRALLEG